jgi:tetratricopeptide (TPR) repeat protein
MPLLAVLVVSLLAMNSALAQQDKAKPAVSKEQQKRMDLMKSRGVDGSLTILPAGLMGKPMVRLSEVIGVLLEKQGLKNIELGSAEFIPAEKSGLQELAAQLGKFVQGQSVKTDYVLYAEMIVDEAAHRINEVRGVVVDKKGDVVWTDTQGPQDEAFKRVEDPDPMGYSVLFCQRLGPYMGLTEETARNAKPGKMEALMRERSGLPPESEMSLMKERQKALKENYKKSVFVVFPARVNGTASSEAAGGLVGLMKEAGIGQPSAAKNTSLLLKSQQTDPNEMKKLWDVARDFKDYLKKNPEQGDYFLYADYILGGYVHFVVCDKNADWVVADLQNSEHPDFKMFMPNSVESANKLVIKRLQNYLKSSAAEVIKMTIQTAGIDAAWKKFKEIRANSEGYFLSEEEMNMLGYEFLGEKKFKEAIAVFKMNVEAFPESWNAFDSLGEAYAAAGEKDLAIENYEKSVKLNPASPSGNEALKKLKGK